MTDTLDLIKQSRGDIAIHAGAGTGKTRALVEKYLEELTRPREKGYAGVDEIAAITFTQKAAAEMSERIRDSLSKEIEKLRADAGKMDGSSANLAQDGPEWDDRKKLLAHLVRQRQALNNAWISTIHSFCARLLYENHFEAGVDPSFKVLDEVEASELLESVVHRVTLRKLRRGDPGVRKLARDFGFSSRGKFSSGLKGYILRIIPLTRAANMPPAKLKSLRRSLLAELRIKREGAVEQIKALLPALEAFGASSLERKMFVALEEMRDVLDDPDNAPVRSAGTLYGKAEELSKKVKERKTYRDGKKAFEESLKIAELVKLAAGLIVEEEVDKDFKSFAALLEEISGVYNLEKEKRAALDFDDLEEKTCALLRRSGQAAKSFLNDFTRTLIDEFQDTNELQEEIVNLIAKPGGGRLFIVGDMKQAIYGFRGADPKVFERVSCDVTAKEGEKFVLNDSWRSTPRLVEYINSLFKTIGRDDGKGKANFNPAVDALKPVREGEGVDTAVEFLVTGNKDQNAEANRIAEARAIAGHIKRMVNEGAMVEDQTTHKLRKASYGDVAVLLRAFTHHEIYERELRKANIDFQVVRGKGFYGAQEIKDIVNLLSYLDYSADRLALVSVLRSPLAGLSDGALLRLCRDSEGRAVSPGIYMDGNEKVPDGLGREDVERLEVFIKRLQSWRNARDRMTISELIETVLAETGYGAVMMSRFNGKQMLANVFKLIELSRVYEAEDIRGLGNFTARLKKMLATQPGESKADITGGEDDVVKLMTVHQSKGLEFNIVFLADTGSSPPHASGKFMFHPEAGLSLQCYDLAHDEWHKGPLFEKASGKIRKSVHNELVRLFYVGLTRARDRLVLSGYGNGEWRRFAMEEGAGLGLEIIEHADSGTVRVEGMARDEAKFVADLLERPRPQKSEPVKDKTGGEDKPFLKTTVTSLATFSLCQRLYYYRNVMELPGVVSRLSFSKRSGEELSGAAMGSRIHEILETIPLGKGAPENALETAVEAGMFDAPVKMKTQALKNLRRSFNRAPLDSLKRIDPGAIRREIPLAHKIVSKDMTVLIHGAADLMWYDGEKWSLVDYKYSLRPADERHYTFQVKLYAYALMTAHKMDALDTAIIYLKEPSKQVSGMSILPIDADDFRQRILIISKRLAKLEGKAESEWDQREPSVCRERKCPFIKRCHGK